MPAFAGMTTFYEIIFLAGTAGFNAHWDGEFVHS
jgi:hypothetical protein